MPSTKKRAYGSSRYPTLTALRRDPAASSSVPWMVWSCVGPAEEGPPPGPPLPRPRPGRPPLAPRRDSRFGIALPDMEFRRDLSQELKRCELLRGVDAGDVWWELRCGALEYKQSRTWQLHVTSLGAQST